LKKEFEVFDQFILKKRLRRSSQREQVLKVFLSTEQHVSIEELYQLVRREHPKIGYTTVYRTMKLLFESGLCNEIELGDGIARFEHEYGHRHHDHLICTKCGRLIEVISPKIEKLQDNLVKKFKFSPLKHKLEIFGICKSCKE